MFAGARNQSGGALLITGDPGIGKTTLVEAALRDQPGLRVLRTQGVEVESTIAYGALQRLGRPLIEYVDELPPAQQTALRIAAGVQQGPPPQPALVGLGFLNLLARAGMDQPTACVVDDAQHADAESLLALGSSPDGSPPNARASSSPRGRTRPSRAGSQVLRVWNWADSIATPDQRCSGERQGGSSTPRLLRTTSRTPPGIPSLSESSPSNGLRRNSPPRRSPTRRSRSAVGSSRSMRAGCGSCPKPAGDGCSSRRSNPAEMWRP
ncbi:AAA family ATPase [Microbacterium trichothecenolyticum]|uniref:AAA family ATPase n=1 Tax=Microbacterium trichothecenolyticum TaxID=69370 RepID=UPI001C9E900A